MTDEEFGHLSPIQQDGVIQDCLIGVEAEADVSYNPVFEAAYDLADELSKRLGPMSRSVRYFYKPSLDGAWSAPERARLMRTALLLGAECTVTTQQFGEVKRQVWIPNFNVPGYSPYGFLDELADLVALDAVRRLADAQARQHS